VEINLASPAFQEGGTIPKQYTGDGRDLSPPLNWTDGPEGTQSFALLCEDPDARRKTWVHWVVYNIPDTARGLNESWSGEKDRSGGAVQGLNDFGKVGYGGPSPPPGRPHRYFFKLFALDTRLPTAEKMTKDRLLEAMNGHILAQGQLVGNYGR
jgi:Raf kinase inhibitor-like YbhB/YbcL family protein